MRFPPRLLMFLGALSLIALFFFPLWKIQLFAPQYPDGVEMHIWINKIGGKTPGTLQNVNILNHYVGMKKIEPDTIAELKYFPKVIIGFVVFGVITAFLNRKSLYLAWSCLFVVVCILGMYDFYLWEYDYGHSLSDTAPIKIEGASFQPPLIGVKEIINFTAVSLPHIGGYFVGLSILLGFGAWFTKRKEDAI